MILVWPAISIILPRALITSITLQALSRLHPNLTAGIPLTRPAVRSGPACGPMRWNAPHAGLGRFVHSRTSDERAWNHSRTYEKLAVNENVSHGFSCSAWWPIGRWGESFLLRPWGLLFRR